MKLPNRIWRYVCNVRIELQSFLSHINKTETCWLWTGTLLPNGYAQYGAHKIFAHRAAYELFKGAIPEGYEVDHLCRVRHCVNPDHLEAVTRRENCLRSDSVSGVNSRKATCKNGHDLSQSYQWKDKRGRVHRLCRACRRSTTRKRLNAEYWRSYRAKRKSQGRSVR